jgi:hypothetical protein
VTSHKVVDLIPAALKAGATETNPKGAGRKRVERSRGKYPWFKFWPDAWLSDPDLSCCSMATQGVWINCLAQIHKQAEGGSITRTVGQFARMFRLTNTELIVALDELADTGTAQINYIRTHPETGELLVDNPVDKFTEDLIKSNLSQFGGNGEKLNYSDQVFVSILSRRMKRDQIKRDTERLRKRRVRDK